MKEENPLVSIVIATYQRKKRLSRALTSLVNQSYKNLEVIIVDDNANEEWNLSIKKIVENFKNKNFRYIRNNENLGSAKSRNVGIKASNGQYITFLDDDDVYTTLKIERQLVKMIESKSDFSITDISIFDTSEKLIENRSRTCLENKDYLSLKLYHMKYHLTGTDSFMFTRKYLFEIGLFPPIDTGDEYYLMDSAIEKRGKFEYIPFSDIRAYVNSAGTGLSSSTKRLQGEKQLLNFKKKDFPLIPFLDRRFILMRYYMVIAYINLQHKKYFNTFFFSIKSLLKHPIGFIKFIMQRKI